MKTRITEIIGSTKLSPEAQNALADHGRYLLSLLPAPYTKLFVDKELPGKKVPVIRLQSILGNIRKAQLVTKHPIPSMLAAVAGKGTKERERHEKLKAWMFLASLALIDRVETVRVACRRVRLLAGEEDRWLLDHILKINDGLDTNVSELDDLRKQYLGLSAEAKPRSKGSGTTKKKTVKADPSKARKVAALHTLLADLLLEREKRGPGPGGQRSLLLTDYSEKLIHTAADDFLFTDIDGVKIISDEQEVTGAGHGVDSASVGNRYLDTVSDSDYPTFLKRRVRQGRELARTFDMRATAAACAWEGLSDNEVLRTLTVCFKDALSGCRASLWIVLALFLGRTPERLWSIPKQVYRETGFYGEFWRVTKKRIQLVSYLSLPDFGLDYDDRQLVEPVHNCLLLPTPKSLTQPLGEALQARMVQEMERVLSGRFTTVEIEHTPKAFAAINRVIA